MIRERGRGKENWARGKRKLSVRCSHEIQRKKKKEMTATGNTGRNGGEWEKSSKSTTMGKREETS